MTKYVAKLVHLPTETTFVLGKEVCEENTLARFASNIQSGGSAPNLPLENGLWAVIPNKIMQECVLLYEDTGEE